MQQLNRSTTPSDSSEGILDVTTAHVASNYEMPDGCNPAHETKGNWICNFD